MNTGDTILGYTILKPLGEGANGYTYLVEKEEGNFVLKELRTTVRQGFQTYAAAVDHFDRECVALRSIRHPLVPAFQEAHIDKRSTDHKFYLVTQYIEGENLATVRANRQLRLEEIVAIGRDVTEVLEHIHTFPQPIIHRDIKPENLILDAQGQTHVIDFGSVNHAIQKSVQFTNAGTFGFAPFESLFGGDPSPSVDIYGLGATLLHLLSGKDITSLIDNLTYTLKVKGNVPSDFEAILQEMTARDPTARAPLGKVKQFFNRTTQLEVRSVPRIEAVEPEILLPEIPTYSLDQLAEPLVKPVLVNSGYEELKHKLREQLLHKVSEYKIREQLMHLQVGFLGYLFPELGGYSANDGDDGRPFVKVKVPYRKSFDVRPGFTMENQYDTFDARLRASIARQSLTLSEKLGAWTRFRKGRSPDSTPVVDFQFDLLQPGSIDAISLIVTTYNNRYNDIVGGVDQARTILYATSRYPEIVEVDFNASRTALCDPERYKQITGRTASVLVIPRNQGTPTPRVQAAQAPKQLTVEPTIIIESSGQPLVRHATASTAIVSSESTTPVAAENSPWPPADLWTFRADFLRCLFVGKNRAALDNAMARRDDGAPAYGKFKIFESLELSEVSGLATYFNATLHTALYTTPRRGGAVFFERAAFLSRWRKNMELEVAFSLEFKLLELPDKSLDYALSPVALTVRTSLEKYNSLLGFRGYSPRGTIFNACQSTPRIVELNFNGQDYNLCKSEALEQQTRGTPRRIGYVPPSLQLR